MKKLLPLLCLAAVLNGPALGADTSPPLPPKEMTWPFDGVFGTYDKGALQRGFQVYKEVCATCHSLDMVAFHDLSAPGGPGFTEAEAKAIAAEYKIPAEPNEQGEIFDDKGMRLTRPGTLADHFPAPYANEAAARAANNAALPPDLSLIVKARRGGANYLYSILTGFNARPPHRYVLPEGKYYNPYFAGRAIAMAPPLNQGSVSFADGTPPTVTNEAKAVTAFLAWASEPQLEARHRIGFQVLAFLLLLSGLLFLTYRKIWRGKH